MRYSFIRGAASVAACLFCTVSFAQKTPVPHFVYINGVLADIGYDVEGFQPSVNAKLVSTKGCVKATASQNSQSLRMAANAINQQPVGPTKWSIHRGLPIGGGTGGGQLSFVLQSLQSLEMPALNFAATEAGYFELMMNVSDVSFDGFSQTTAAERTRPKEQKKWLPANYRVNVGDLPANHVSQVGGYEISQGADDINGDGKPDFEIEDVIEITLPAEDAQGYLAWSKATDAAGQPVTKPLSIEYDDANGNPVLVVTVNVYVESIGFADALLGQVVAPGRDVQVNLRAKGIIAVKSATGSGA